MAWVVSHCLIDLFWYRCVLTSYQATGGAHCVSSTWRLLKLCGVETRSCETDIYESQGRRISTAKTKGSVSAKDTAQITTAILKRLVGSHTPTADYHCLIKGATMPAIRCGAENNCDTKGKPRLEGAISKYSKGLPASTR